MKNVLEKINLVHLVNAEYRFRVRIDWNIDEGEWCQVRLIKGMFAARRETRLFTSSNGCKYGIWTIHEECLFERVSDCVLQLPEFDRSILR